MILFRQVHQVGKTVPHTNVPPSHGARSPLDGSGRPAPRPPLHDHLATHQPHPPWGPQAAHVPTQLRQGIPLLPPQPLEGEGRGL